MIDWHAVGTTALAVVRWIGGTISAAVGVALPAYFLIPPFRKLVDGWIEHRFDKQLAEHKHELTMLADIERARLQRTVQNSALVVARKHEVFRQLFHKLHSAMGKVTHLFGVGSMPTFETWDREDLKDYMNEKPRFPGVIREAILANWDIDRDLALVRLRKTSRDRVINEAERAFARAWNYFLGNELYLPDPIAQKAHQAFKPLFDTLNLAKYPGARGDYSASAKEASERVTELKNLLRAELRVVDEEPSKSLQEL